MILDGDAAQVKQLDSVKLVRLMKLLMLAECRLVNIPLRAATVPLQITVPDGGEDGRVEWSGGVDATDFFPDRFSIFQSKAQNLTPTTIGAEALAKPRKGRKAALKPAVSDVVSRGGAYVVFCYNAFTGQKITKLKKAIETSIRTTGRNPADAEAIEIYDANRIADWVNTHPSVALWLATQIRGRAISGFQTHESWGRASDISGIPWIDDGEPRFVPANYVVPVGERKDKRRNAWTFDQAAEAALRHLSEDKVAARIAGPSGFGKTRFAYELFNRRASGLDEIETAAVIFVDFSIGSDEILKLALEIAEAGSPTILVVDECPDDMHIKLAGLAKRVGSRLRIVTMDVETKVVQAKESLVIRLEPAATKQIGAIARAVDSNLSDSDVRFIEELSHGFPQMAVLAARENADGRQTIQSVEQLLGRIIWGTRLRSEEAERALEFLSLFEWVGLTKRVGDHAAVIAGEFAGMTEDAFVAQIKSFTSRGIIEQRGDYAQVAPIPLAARLGAHRLSLLADGKLVAFFGKAPADLKENLLRRLRWLDTAPEAMAFAQTLLAPDNLGNLAALNTDFGAKCLDRLVHVDPATTMATIDRVFGGLSNDELRAVSEGRRHLVWALEKLAFRKESFDRAATLLRRLATAETEDRISNNANGQFKQLYQLYLSGTEAEPNARLLVLDDGLRSSDLRERDVCFEALGHMLDTGHFTRGGGAEEIGSGERLKDWAPKTAKEIHDYLRAAIDRLVGLADSDNPLALRAKQILGSSIRRLLSHLPLNEVKEIVSRIIARYGFWPEAVQDVNEWLYFDRRAAPKARGKEIRTYFNELMPADPVDLAVLYTHGWQADFHDPDIDFDREDKTPSRYDYSIRQSVKLADSIAADLSLLDRAVTSLATSDAKSVLPFARRLAALVPDPVKLFESALAKVEATPREANRQFFGGIIAGADERDPEKARACIRAALRSEKLKSEAISMIGAGSLQPRDIVLVISLLQSGDVRPWQCALLSYGRGMDHFSAADIAPLLEELTKHGAEGLWTALDIISMVLYGGRAPAPTFVAALKQILLAPALFDRVLRGTMDGHHLHEMVKLLLEHGAIDRKFARALVKQLLGICDRREPGVFHALDEPVRQSLRELLAPYPKEVWGGVTRLLLTNDWQVRHRLDSLLQSRRDNNLGAGVLFSLPAKLYLDWARKDSARRAEVVVNWIPIAEKNEDGSLSWHPALVDFVSEFGALAGVSSTIRRRLYPTSWWGSLAPFLEPLLPLLVSWSNHKIPEVRQWAQKQIDSVRADIRRAEQEDAESIVRY